MEIDAQPRTTPNSNSVERRSALRGGSTGLTGVVVQSAALISPAVGATAGMVFIGTQSGFASPFIMVIGTVFSVCLAVVIGEFARKLPTAGSFYTYLTHAFGPKTGFLAGVMLFGAYILLLPFQLSFFGSFLSTYLAGHGVQIAWQWFAAALIVFTSGLTIAGLALSLEAGLIFLVFEVIVFGLIAVVTLAHGGASGLTLRPFSPSESALGFSGIVYGLVYSVFAFVGFESATTLGEEAKDARRTIPKAVLISAIIIGIFFTLLIYSGVVGFGLTAQGLAHMQADATPFQTLARRFSGSALSTISVIALVSSFTALNITTVTAGSRMIYAMGRDRLLPRWFDHINGRGAPDRAIIAIAIVFLAITLVLGSIYTPSDLAAWASYIATLFFIAAYALLCFGVVRYYWQRHRDEFSVWRHVIIPAIGLVGVGVVTYGNVHPTPPSPLRWFIWATLATIVAAVAIAFYLQRRNPHRLVEAGQLFAQATPEDAQADGVASALIGAGE